MSNKPNDAASAFDALLEEWPRKESALAHAALLSQNLSRHDQAFEYWRRAVAINPTLASHHAELARVWLKREDWPKVLAECEAALKLNLSLGQTRVLLITACIKTRDKARARAEFEKLLALQRALEKAGPSPFERMGRPGFEEMKLDPQAEEKLRKWLEDQLR